MTAETNTGPMIGQRHLQTFLLFLSIVVNYMAKFNAGVAVVAMTNAENTNPNFPEYDWNEMERSYILSSFFWGYILTQFMGGWLCRRYGARITMFVSTIGSALLVVLIPWCVSWGGWQAYCGIRMSMGLFQGFLFPCIHAHLANWCPVKERNRLGALANTGIDCGTLVACLRVDYWQPRASAGPASSTSPAVWAFYGASSGGFSEPTNPGNPSSLAKRN
ncbi:GM15957 [Drosophila sechellia]|uniref:GM15957 n=1 Tax=Drosophila sechellia TaxID=7238 RepID=B4I8B7_DROSE|nr:GM15957 [Drosophila sechellia]